MYFGRCIFLSWYCEKATCKFCFRSTTKHKIKHAKNARRSKASVLADAVIGKQMGWHIEFLTGGYGIFNFDEIVEIAKEVSEIYNEKIWINLGLLEKEELEKLKPYVEGVCASIETIEPNLHNKICPDKPIEPYTEMLEMAREMGFKTSMTIVIGLGEKKEDFQLLKEYIEKNQIDRITFYALKPVKETEFENVPSPETEYYAWWIEQTRKAFPKIKIMAGLTPKKIDYIPALIKAGVDGITKLPAVRKFGSEFAQKVEDLVNQTDHFEGTLTKLPNVDWRKVCPSEEVYQKVKQSLKL